MMVQGVASGLIHGWVDFHLDVPTVCPATQPNQAIFPSVQSELGRQWNDLNQCQPNHVSDHQPHPVKIQA